MHLAPFRWDARQGVFKPVDTLLAPSGDHFTPKRPERAIGGPDIWVSSGKYGQVAIQAALVAGIDAETGEIVLTKLLFGHFRISARRRVLAFHGSFEIILGDLRDGRGGLDLVSR